MLKRVLVTIITLIFIGLVAYSLYNLIFIDKDDYRMDYFTLVISLVMLGVLLFDQISKALKKR